MDLFNFIKQKFLRILNYSAILRTSGDVLQCNYTVRERKSTEYSCTWIYLIIFLSIVYFLWRIARHSVRQTLVPHKVTRSTKLWGAQRAPEFALRSTEFRSPENLVFPALSSDTEKIWFSLLRHSPPSHNITFFLYFT